MIGLSYIFSTYTSCSRHQKVKIADGSLSYVVGKGLTVLGRWKACLYCNLISISKLTHDLNYCSKFSPTHCVFQNLCSGKRIKSAREMEGLFVLGEEVEKISKALQCESSFSSEIMLWHSRLVHPCFAYLKKLCPSLFLSKNVNWLSMWGVWTIKASLS